MKFSIEKLVEIKTVKELRKKNEIVSFKVKIATKI